MMLYLEPTLHMEYLCGVVFRFKIKYNHSAGKHDRGPLFFYIIFI